MVRINETCACASCAVWVRNLVSHFGEEQRLRVFENRVLRRIFGRIV